MTFPETDWREQAPATQGVDPAALNNAIAQLERNVGKDGVKELVIVRNGYLIWKGTDIDKMHGVWSVTKSFTSTVLGLLIDEGKATLDTRAKEYAPELADSYAQVTLRHFATMTSGYRAKGDEPRGSYTHGPSETPFDPDPIPLFAPGAKYAYWDSAMNELGYLLTRIAGEPIEELFKHRIADPIGMNRAKWDWGDFGERGEIVVNGGAGNANKHVQISARELARLGHLFLNRGRWRGKQLLSEKWIGQATRAQVTVNLELGHAQSGIDGRGVYGLNWWVNGLLPDGKRKWPEAPFGTFAAVGFNNNKCFVVPEWNLVVVRLGLDGNVSDEVWNQFFGNLSKAIR